jgi:hypothetical protein
MDRFLLNEKLEELQEAGLTGRTSLGTGRSSAITDPSYEFIASCTIGFGILPITPRNEPVDLNETLNTLEGDLMLLDTKADLSGNKRYEV